MPPQATTGKTVLSLLWRIPLIAIGLTLWVLALEGLPVGLAVVLFVAGALSVAAGFVRSGNSYLPTIVVAAVLADFCAVMAFFAWFSAALAT